MQDDVGGVVHAHRQVLDGAFAKLVHSEDVVVDVGDAVDVVLEDVDAEGVTQLWLRKQSCSQSFVPTLVQCISFFKLCDPTVLDAVDGHHWIAAVEPHAAD